MPFINDGDFLTFKAGDTAFGVEIDEPNWDLTGAAARVRVEGLLSHLPVTPFDGQVATIALAKTPARIQYSWPSGLVAGKYRVWFVVTFASGIIASTEEVGVLVEAA